MAATPRITQVDLFLDEAETSLVQRCLGDRWLTEGQHARRLQQLIVDKLGCRHVFFAPNGTLGLFLALLALELPRDSEIIIPTFTFYGSAMAAFFAGLRLVFADVDPHTFNATEETIRAKVTSRTRAIMPVHIYGQTCAIEGIGRLARELGLAVVEDAAQAFGVRYQGRAAGTFGDIGVFSFYSDKSVTMGEGGVLVTNDDTLAERIRLLRNQGRPNAGTFIHPMLGMNFRITDMQAALGCAQVAKLEMIGSERSRKWARYLAGLNGVGDLEFMQVTAGSELCPFRFPILTAHREQLTVALEAAQIQCRGFFYPMHLQPKLRTDPPESLPVAEMLHERGLCLPIHHHITDPDIDEIVGVIRRFFNADG
jgi:perosamine synthetase